LPHAENAGQFGLVEDESPGACGEDQCVKLKTLIE
jgi:hypothetical protein